MIRRLVIAVAVLAVLAVAADRVAEWAAARLVADRTQAAAGLAHRPSVTFRGFPFLTQLLRGRYQQVDVSAHSVVVDGLSFATVSARLSGVRLDLDRALHGQVSAVPVRQGAGTAVVTYSALDGYAKAHGLPVTLTEGSGGQVHVSGGVDVAGQRLSAGADAHVAVSDGQIQVLPLANTLRGLSAALPAAVRTALLSALTVHLPVGALPLGLRLTGVAVTGTGLTFQATSSGVDIPVQAAGRAPGHPRAAVGSTG